MGCWSSFWNTGPGVTWDPYKFTDSDSQCAIFRLWPWWSLVAIPCDYEASGVSLHAGCRYLTFKPIEIEQTRSANCTVLGSKMIGTQMYSVTVNTQMSWHGLVKFGGEIASRRRIHIGCYLPVASQPNNCRQCIYRYCKIKPVCNITRKMAAVVYCNLKSRRFQATLRSPTENASLNLNV